MSTPTWSTVAYSSLLQAVVLDNTTISGFRTAPLAATVQGDGTYALNVNVVTGSGGSSGANGNVTDTGAVPGALAAGSTANADYVISGTPVFFYGLSNGSLSAQDAVIQIYDSATTYNAAGARMLYQAQLSAGQVILFPHAFRTTYGIVARVLNATTNADGDIQVLHG